MKRGFAEAMETQRGTRHTGRAARPAAVSERAVRHVQAAIARVARRIVPCGILLALSIGCGADLPPGDPEPFNVVLISIDTLAADHLGLYGYPRETSPNLDRYAENAIVFENAYSTAPKTPESHMSMFTSLYPSVHGVFTIDDPTRLRALGDSVRTLPEILAQNGYATVGFHAGGYLDAQFGFGRGFGAYRKGEQRRAEEWLWRNAAKGRFFLFFHTYRVHDPYTPKPPFDRRFDPDYAGPIVHDLSTLEQMVDSTRWADYSAAFWKAVDKSDPREVAHVVALYDAAIAEMDAELVGLLNAIDRHAPRTIVIILSDHGEEFGEHAMFTHSQLYGETLHVPLIIRHPDRKRGERIADRVSLIDLAPTVLDLLSIPPDEQFQGRSLLDPEHRVGSARSVFSEFPLGNRAALVDRDLKLMLTGAREELYDLRRDPAEQRDLLGSEIAHPPAAPTPEPVALREEMARIARQNASVRDRLGVRGSSEAPEGELLQQLKALGYLE